MNPSVLVDTPELVGQDVLLTPLDERWLGETAALVAEPEVRRLTGTHPTFTPDQVRGHLAELPSRPDRAGWAVRRGTDGGYVGEVVLQDLDVPNQSMSFRIALSSRQLGRGYGTEATRLVLDFGFDVVGLHRIALEVFAFNPRAAHVYRKCGFRQEGVRRHALYWDGEWVDAIDMSVLATDSRLRWARAQTR
ncbi:GNAT family N-acetyltransferase [Amycolatopsis suaedae]|uniref:GNAT family N-acetyltransferase n=1 Tax=Amycolatopsis suaedae TaxID=2510978 RepID=UPI001F105C98|nr:GNAT family protein [Amycolatopsis suaedae]